MQNIRKQILNADDLNFLYQMQQPAIMINRHGIEPYWHHRSRPNTIREILVPHNILRVAKLDMEEKFTE